MVLFSAGIVLSAACTCCTLFSSYACITVVFPTGGSPWEAYGGVSSYFLVYPDPLGDDKDLLRLEVKRGTKGAVIKIRKGSSVPVALYPEGALKPAGGIYPLDLQNPTTLLLSDTEGFLADMLLELHREAGRIEGVDIQRLREVIGEKCGGDPWSIDKTTLEMSLLFGSLSVYKVKRLASRDIAIPGVPGKWIADDPFIPGRSADSGGTLYLQLCPGMYAFLERETLRELYVHVSGDHFEYLLRKKP